MKRILKKNQLIIAALAVMIAAAGYLNYSGRLLPGSQNTKEAGRIKNFWIFRMKMLPVLPGISKARTAMKAK